MSKQAEAFEISEKRFYCPMPEVDCPKCGAPSEAQADYLSYPTANKVFKLDFVCRKCNPDPYIEAQTFECDVILRCVLEAA